jgi:hypothetical protein
LGFLLQELQALYRSEAEGDRSGLQELSEQNVIVLKAHKKPPRYAAVFLPLYFLRVLM